MSGEARGLTHLSDLRARLKPGSLCFTLADRAQAQDLRQDLPGEGRVWLSWRQREALLGAWRPAAQERYHSVAGRDAPSVADWLAPRFRHWQEGPDGVSRLMDDAESLAKMLKRCHLEPLAQRSISLLSNGEAARACLAAALAPRPALLVLEDLSEGLDADGRGLLLEVAEDAAREGVAVLVLASRPGLLPWSDAVGTLSAPSRPPHYLGTEVFSCQGLDLDAGTAPLLRGLDWTLRGGEAWWLQGVNGAGKSTLLAYLSGEHPQAWAQSWRLMAKERGHWTPIPKLKEQVAWVSPELAAAAHVPMLSLLEKALASPAHLLLLDEPLRGLNNAQLAAWEDRLGQAVGLERAVVFITHAPEEAPLWLNRVLRLEKGGAWSIA
jgi:ABC-type molybdenum transport system ATPase subunit/photorepair protein PhrA